MAKFDDDILAEGEKAELAIYLKLSKKIINGEPVNAQEIKRFQEIKAKLERKRDETEICRTKADAARYAGVSERVIRYHVKKKTLRQNDDGTFDKSEMDRWQAHKKPSKDPAKKNDPEARYREARAREKEEIVRRLRGEVILVAQVEKMFSDRAHAFAKALDMLPRRISLRVAGEAKKPYQAVFEIIESECHGILAAYSRPLEGLRGNPSGKRID